MIEMEISIWMATKERWVHLVKKIFLPVVPRVGEFMKFHSEQMGDYFSWEVSEITYRESGVIEVWTELLDNVDDRLYSFEEESEFDEYYNAYLSEGWTSPKGIRENTQYKTRQNA